MRKEINLAAFILALLFACAGSFVAPARAQSVDSAGDAGPFVAVPDESFVIFQNEQGDTVCRVATAEERARIQDARDTHVIYRGAPLRRAATDGGEVLMQNGPADSTGLPLLPSAGLTIVLQGTSQLESNPTAKNAFIAAANRWEAIISTPITVTLSVDYGPNFFDQGAYPSSGILGQTGSFVIKSGGNDPSLASVRSRLIQNSNPSAAELQLYNSLPTTSIPAEFNGTTVDVSSVRVLTSQARAIGFSFPAGTDAQIGFNSNFGNGGQFDFDPTDGITAGFTDFDAVVTHEIGHALGFSSANGGTSSAALTIWDLFRFRPSTASVASFATVPRVLTKGGTQVFFGNFTTTFATQELGLSTGGPNPPEGDTDDGRQSSHWKADELLSTRPYIGIMDPTLSRGLRRTISENDIHALDLLGYSVVLNPVRPDNDNFASALALAGASGNFTGTNISATREAGEPNHAGFQGDKSVWFTWTAPTTGTATFDTIGSTFDTTLGVYRGTSVTFLATDAASDDVTGLAGGVSRATFNTTAGTVYRIAVDGWNGEFGNVQLNWTSTGTTPTPTPTPVPASFTVTGRVFDPDGSILVNVRFILEGPTLTNGSAPGFGFSNADGFFQFTNLAGGGNYTIRPADARYNFNPATAVFNNISADQGILTFTATSASPTVMTGTVSENGQGLSGVAVALYGFGPLRILKQTTTDASGRYTFNGQTIGQGYNVVFLKSGYAFTPPTLIISQIQTTTDLGDVPASKTNPIEKSDFFVAQHYRDFLGREPDAPGLQFWTNEIEGCGFDFVCRQVKRVNVSAAFFLSIEFQNTGYLVERMYKTAYGDVVEPSTGLIVPVITRNEFTQDTPFISSGVVVNVGNWQAQLEANKVAYAQTFVERARFTTAYPTTMTPAQFVSKLNQNTGNALSQAQADALAAELALNNTSAGRAVVLRKVAESAEVDAREKNRAFVLMQYYGYLRRDPNAAPEQNLNFAGWNFWLSKLAQFNGNFVKAEMVKAFLDSTEYRQRFAQ